jgi:hypothetical protein
MVAWHLQDSVQMFKQAVSAVFLHESTYSSIKIHGEWCRIPQRTLRFMILLSLKDPENSTTGKLNLISV